MIPLSTALARGKDYTGCPLRAAYLGAQREQEAQRFLALCRDTSPEGTADMLLRELHRMWPVLGESVEHNKPLFTELDRINLVGAIRPAVGKPFKHLSLWRAITTLADRREWTHTEIADLLQRCGL